MAMGMGRPQPIDPATLKWMKEQRRKLKKHPKRNCDHGSWWLDEKGNWVCKFCGGQS